MLRMRPPARVGCFVLLASLLLLVNARLEALAQSDSFPTSTEWEEIEKVWEEAARVWAAAEAAWPARETRTPEEWHLAEEWWRVAVGNREAQFGWLWATEVWGETIRAWACLSPDRPCVDPDIDYDNAWNEARRAAEGAWAAATNTALWAEAWGEIAMTETEKTQASEAAEAAWSAAEAAYAASKAGAEIDDFLPYAVNPLPDLPLPPSDRRVFWGPRSKTATAEPTPPQSRADTRAHPVLRATGPDRQAVPQQRSGLPPDRDRKRGGKTDRNGAGRPDRADSIAQTRKPGSRGQVYH